MFSSYLKEPATRRFLLLVSLFVFLLSTIISITHHDRLLLGDPEKLNNDDVKYIHTSRVLLHEGTLVYNSGDEPSAFIMPGLPLILSGFMAVFGDEGGVTAFRVFQALLQALCIYLIYFIARYTFNHRAAVIATLLSALYLPDYFTSGSVLTEGTYRFVVFMLLCSMILAVHYRKTSWYIAVGVLTAAAAYFKPQASLYPAIMLFLWLAHRYSFKEMVRYTLTIVISYIILLIPWWIRNMETFGDFILFTSSGGSPFLLGTRIDYQLPPAGFFAVYPQYDPETIFMGADESAVKKGLDILKYGFSQEPMTYLYHYTIGRFNSLYMVPFYLRDIFSIKKAYVEIVQTILVYAGLLGIVWAGFKRSWKPMLPALLTFAYFTAIHLPFVAMSRYGYPTIFFFMIFAGFVVDQLMLMYPNYKNKKSKGGMIGESLDYHSGLQ
ncbi:glycosyltransferase family 39 protein [Paenibacillus sp. DMB20]|uniref:glycosyltransferase family 39 protein n=1 Tax=Paenibacillus sp. DMB20 TaxID=1642570 RepID=UPI0009E50338|nr:glycosyltransferase family 39 protein [Paenibacillus sp. DMB20]